MSTPIPAAAARLTMLKQGHNLIDFFEFPGWSVFMRNVWFPIGPSRRLPRWPGEPTSAQDVDVEMIDRLPGVPAAIDHRPETVLIQPFAFGQARRPEKKRSENLLVGIEVGGDMLFRDDQEVNRRLGIDILEGQAAFVLIQDFCFQIT
jgi:hypothetical protein